MKTVLFSVLIVNVFVLSCFKNPMSDHGIPFVLKGYINSLE